MHLLRLKKYILLRDYLIFENIVRKAIPEEIRFYEKIFYPLQDDIFSLIQTDRLYLSESTCLSRFIMTIVIRKIWILNRLFNKEDVSLDDFSIKLIKRIIDNARKQG